MAFNNSPTIAKAFGIPIQLHWSFILLLLLSLISPIFFLYIIVLFVFVTIHEIFHSITAKNNGISVRKIVLYPLGGGSVIDMSGVSGPLELKIALVGPLSNFFMAGFFGIFTLIFNLGVMHLVFQILFLINILLGVLNIIPAFPLDGGRVLRGFIQKGKDKEKATLTVAKLSNIIAVIFLLLGIVFLFVGNYSEGYRIVLLFSFLIVTVYLYYGTQAEVYGLLINKTVEGIKQDEIITKKYKIIRQDTSIAEVYKILKNDHLTPIIYKKGGRYMIVSDLPLNIIKIRDGNIWNRSLSDFSAEVAELDYRSKTSKILNELELGGYNAAVLLKKGNVFGLVTRSKIFYIIAAHASNKERLK